MKNKKHTLSIGKTTNKNTIAQGEHHQFNCAQGLVNKKIFNKLGHTNFILIMQRNKLCHTILRKI